MITVAMSGKNDNNIHLMPKIVLGMLGLVLGLHALAIGSERANDPPNIVLFVSDDHAQMDSGIYGNEIIKTPNIDRLAKEGMKFTEAYAITSTCVPSRASLFTGLGPHRHGSHENHSRIDEGIKTLPQYLSDLGYRVILAGKTHIKPLDAYPFEYMDTEGDWNSVIVKKGSEVEQFLSGEASSGNPFCLVIATNNPHVPWPRDNEYDPENIKLPPFLLDTEDTRKAMTNYYSDVTNMDRELGRTLDLLQENNLEKETAVIYTSDHGPQFPHGKWELYDYGIKVPFIVRWPEKTNPGSTNHAKISLIDVLPTIVEIAGGSSPQNIDGRSFVDILKGQSDSHRKVIYATHTRDLNMNYFPIRTVRTDRYKYILNLSPERAFTNHITNSNNFEENGGEQLWNSWLKLANSDPEARKYIRTYQHRSKEELYDLKADPHELKNLADDPEFEDVKNRLRQKLVEWMDQQGDKGIGAW